MLTLVLDKKIKILCVQHCGTLNTLSIFLAPSGGPHSQFPAEWNCTTAGLVKLGFAVLMGEASTRFMFLLAEMC